MISSALHVLVVEDDPDLVELARHQLGRELPHAQVRHARSLQGALEVLVSGLASIDVVVLDLGLPDAEGLEALKALLALPLAPPIVVLTALSPDLSEAALALGAQDYVRKADLREAKVLARAVAFAVQRHRHQFELHDQRGRLLQLNALLQHFAASTAHDLKGPLATALMSLMSARREVLDARPELRDELLDRAESVLRRASGQVDQLLADVQMAHQGGEELLDLAKIVEGARASLPEADRLTVSLELGAPVQSRVAAMRQIVQNLLENALAHNPDRATHVRIRTITSPPFTCVVFEDDGVGIPADRRDHVMRAGATGPASTGRGLGLATVMLASQALGGAVMIEDSADLGGASITVVLPQADVAAASPSSSTQVAGPQTEGVH